MFTGMFFIIFVSSWVFFNNVSLTFAKMTFTKKSEYIARVVASIHAILAVIASVIGMLYKW